MIFIPTAIASIPSGTYTHVKSRLEGLQYTTNNYDNIYFKLFKWNGSSWDYQTSYSNSGSYWGSSYTYAEYTFTYLEPEKTYTVQVFVNYSGTWYPEDPDTGNGYEGSYVATPAIPKPVVTEGTPTYTSITFSRTITAGALTTQIYIDGVREPVGSTNFYNAGYSYSTSGDSITISGLDTQTRYYFSVINTIEGYIQYNAIYDGAQAQIVQYSTLDYPTLSTPNRPTLVKRTGLYDGGFNISWNDTSDEPGHSGYTTRRSTDSITYTIDGTTTSTSYAYTGLQYGRQYFLDVRANGVNPSAYSTDLVATSAPKTPTLSVTGVTNTSISVSIGVSAGYWNYVKVWYRIKNSSDSWNSITITHPSTTDTISGLTYNTEYELKASSFKNKTSGDTDYNATPIESVDGNGDVQFSSLIYAVATQRPSDWAWTTTITAGTDVPSVVGKTIYIMPATEWEAFTDKINEFRIYKGLTSYSFTSVSTNTEFTKTILNQALTAIRAMSAYFTGGNTVPADRVAGDNILQASVYQNMRDAMNSIT